MVRRTPRSTLTYTLCHYTTLFRSIATPAPASAVHLNSVARVQRGMVVLPDLDLKLSPEEGDSIGPFDPDPVSGSRRRAIETHPQFALKLDRKSTRLNSSHQCASRMPPSV